MRPMVWTCLTPTQSTDILPWRAGYMTLRRRLRPLSIPCSCSVVRYWHFPLSSSCTAVVTPSGPAVSSLRSRWSWTWSCYVCTAETIGISVCIRGISATILSQSPMPPVRSTPFWVVSYSICHPGLWLWSL